MSKEYKVDINNLQEYGNHLLKIADDDLAFEETMATCDGVIYTNWIELWEASGNQFLLEQYRNSGNQTYMSYYNLTGESHYLTMYEQSRNPDLLEAFALTAKSDYLVNARQVAARLSESLDIKDEIENRLNDLESKVLGY